MIIANILAGFTTAIMGNIIPSMKSNMLEDEQFAFIDLRVETPQELIFSAQFAVGHFYYREFSADPSGNAFALSRDRLFIFPDKLRAVVYWHRSLERIASTSAIKINFESKVIERDSIEKYLKLYQHSNAASKLVKLSYISLFSFKNSHNLTADLTPLDPTCPGLKRTLSMSSKEISPPLGIEELAMYLFKYTPKKFRGLQ